MRGLSRRIEWKEIRRAFETPSQTATKSALSGNRIRQNLPNNFEISWRITTKIWAKNVIVSLDDVPTLTSASTDSSNKCSEILLWNDLVELVSRGI